jgi:septal ring-binding cell division protein DamX
LADSHWLLQQEAASLTVQLAGLSSEEAVKAFLTQHATALAGKPVALTVTHTIQGTRYNLFYGVFDSLEQARTAIEALPTELRTNQP